VEEIFGWTKTVGMRRKLRYRGVERNRLWVEMTMAAYNPSSTVTSAGRDA
jgi:hypothetical protein